MKSHHHRLQTWFAGILCGCMVLSSLFGLWRAVSICRAYQIAPLTDAQLAALDLSHTTRLMIVAHPDDETLWGGAHLQNGGYLVVCITNGNHPTRAAEFQKVMEASGNIGLILSYPDKTAGERDNWIHIRTRLQEDLEKVMTYLPWELIATHNAAGEYGHVHHQMTHQLVAAAYDANSLEMPLYTFQKYYRATLLCKMKDDLTKISAEELRCKEALLQYYTSQSSTTSSLAHMNPYESWTQIRGRNVA